MLFGSRRKIWIVVLPCCASRDQGGIGDHPVLAALRVMLRVMLSNTRSKSRWSASTTALGLLRLRSSYHPDSISGVTDLDLVRGAVVGGFAITMTSRRCASRERRDQKLDKALGRRRSRCCGYLFPKILTLSARQFLLRALRSSTNAAHHASADDDAACVQQRKPAGSAYLTPHPGYRPRT